MLLLIGIVGFLAWLRVTADGIERSRIAAAAGRSDSPTAVQRPKDFWFVEQEFPRVQLLNTREDVERMLGPPTEEYGWGDQMAEWEPQAAHSHRHFGIPRDRVWAKWFDPRDAGRWVAVLFADGKVYARLKHGF